jgi:hypothetical protein
LVARRGRSSLGCLFTLLIAAAVGYFAVNAGESYWRYFQFQDAMQQEARFARQRTNEQILTRLRASVDSLGLPEEAAMISIRRSTDSISIGADYDEHVEMPMYVKAIHYRPRATGPL